MYIYRNKYYYYYLSCLAFLLCRMVRVLMVGNCRIISLGTVEVGLSCHCLPPPLTACWVHGNVDSLNHCNVFMTFSKSKVFFTEINPTAFFKHSYSWGLKVESNFAILSSWNMMSGPYGVTSPCTSCRILIRLELINPSCSFAWVTTSPTGRLPSCRTLYILNDMYLWVSPNFLEKSAWKRQK